MTRSGRCSTGTATEIPRCLPGRAAGHSMSHRRPRITSSPFWEAIKVTVIGRHLFNTTNGWDGDPAAGDELVTHRPLPQAWLADHPDAPFHTAGSVEAGIALA